jgi:hypothetical protein
MSASFKHIYLLESEQKVLRLIRITNWIIVIEPRDRCARAGRQRYWDKEISIPNTILRERIVREYVPIIAIE